MTSRAIRVKQQIADIIRNNWGNDILKEVGTDPMWKKCRVWHKVKSGLTAVEKPTVFLSTGQSSTSDIFTFLMYGLPYFATNI